MHKSRATTQRVLDARTNHAITLPFCSVVFFYPAGPEESGSRCEGLHGAVGRGVLVGASCAPGEVKGNIRGRVEVPLPNYTYVVGRRGSCVRLQVGVGPTTVDRPEFRCLSGVRCLKRKTPYRYQCLQLASTLGGDLLDTWADRIRNFQICRIGIDDRVCTGDRIIQPLTTCGLVPGVSSAISPMLFWLWGASGFCSFAGGMARPVSAPDAGHLDGGVHRHTFPEAVLLGIAWDHNSVMVHGCVEVQALHFIDERSRLPSCLDRQVRVWGLSPGRCIVWEISRQVWRCIHEVMENNGIMRGWGVGQIRLIAKVKDSVLPAWREVKVECAGARASSGAILRDVQPTLWLYPFGLWTMLQNNLGYLVTAGAVMIYSGFGMHFSGTP